MTVGEQITGRCSIDKNQRAGMTRCLRVFRQINNREKEQKNA